MAESKVVIRDISPTNVAVRYSEITINTFFYGEIIDPNGKTVWIGANKPPLFLKTQDNIVNLSNGGGVAHSGNVKEIRNYRPVDVEITVTDKGRL